MGSNGNAEPGVLTSLLKPDGAGPSKQSRQDLIERLIEDGDLTGAEQHIRDLSNVAPDHGPCVVAKSDARLIFYICGYVARKYVLKINCDECRTLLLISRESVELLGAADYTRLKDNGGLLYPHGRLFRFISKLEDLFTSCFSLQELHHDSIMDIVHLIKKKQQDRIGCVNHAESLTVQMVAFYVTTRLHFFVKALNRARCQKRDAAKYLKLSRCT